MKFVQRYLDGIFKLLEMASDLKVRVFNIKGKCPVYKAGDHFRIIRGFKLVAENPVYMHSLASIMPYYTALSRGVKPIDLGLWGPNNCAYVQCLDPCEYIGGGTVVFSVSVEEGEGK